MASLGIWEMLMMTKLFLPLAILSLCGCATGEAERKSPLNVLNGEHYAGSSAYIGSPNLDRLPIGLRRKNKSTTIRGTVMVQQVHLPQPLRGVQVQLMDRDNQLIAEGLSQADGSYVLNADIPNGRYQLIAEFKNYATKQVLTVSQYEIDNVILTLKQN